MTEDELPTQRTEYFKQWYERAVLFLKKWQNSDQKELALKTLHDYRDEVYRQGKKEGKLEGYQLGQNDGERKGKEEMAKTMAKALKEKGIDANIIAESSGLSIQEIEEL